MVKDLMMLKDHILDIKILDNHLIITQQITTKIKEHNIKFLSRNLCIMEHQSMIIKNLKFQHIRIIFQDIILQHIKDHSMDKPK